MARKNTVTPPAPATSMRFERVAVAALIPDPQNARLHPERNLAAIEASLRRFGQQKPIVVDADGIVLAGNGTLEAAKRLGWTEVDVHRTELRGQEARAFAIADNRTSELAEWDYRALAASLGDLDTEQKAATGWSEAELETLSAADWNPGTPGQMPGAAGGHGDGHAVKFTAEQWALLSPVLGEGDAAAAIVRLLT